LPQLLKKVPILAKNKLAQFAENKTFKHMFEPSMDEAWAKNHPLIGKWGKEFFKNDNPIVLELGCGKGEYTVALAKQNPNKNFIGMDIKGARMWRGAKTVEEERLPNVAFLRMRVEFVASFFGPQEIDEIWCTFSDPQPKKANKRLTSPYYLNIYKPLLKPNAVMHLKTDSRLLFNSTIEQVEENNYTMEACVFDVYDRDWDKLSEDDKAIMKIKTFYEAIWIKKKFAINYLRFRL
jgi:tRNA (guanine-N7-)-methyltransferase